MYFHWEKKAFDQKRGAGHVPVVIAGAGPIGLAMAQALARQGIACCVLEMRDQVSDGSRAIALTRRTMQIFDAIGVGASVLSKAVLWDLNAVHFGERLVYEMRLPQPSGERHQMTNLQQCWVEQVLLDHLATGPADIRWQSCLTGLEQGPDGLMLTVQRPDGSDYSLTTEYLIAADGVRGATRRLVGLPYEGERYEQHFVITDFHMKSAREIGRRVWFSPPYARGTTVLQHSGPFDICRLDYQLLPEDDPNEEMSPRRVAERVAAHLQMVGETAPYDIIWSSIYRASALTLPSYQKGRVFFIGDAAHQIPIFGGRGVNNGFMDVMNLGWKLGHVMRSEAPDTLLATYTNERRPFILDTIEDLSRVTVYMTSPSPAVALMRDAVLSLSLSESFVHTLFDPFRVPPYTMLSVGATDSAKAGDAAFDTGPVIGQVIPDMPLDAVGGRLFDQLGDGFACLAWGGTAEADRRVQSLFEALARANPAVICLSLDTAAAAAFGAEPGTAYLVRPDHHVAGRWKRADPADLLDSLHHALGRRQACQPVQVG